MYWAPRPASRPWTARPSPRPPPSRSWPACPRSARGKSCGPWAASSLLRLAQSVRRVGNLAGHDGREDGTAQELARIGGAHDQGVEVHDRDVRPAAGGEHTGLLLPGRRVGVPGRVAAHRFFRSHALLGIPAAGWLELLVAPRDRGVQAVEDVVVGAGEVGVEGEPRPRLAKRAPSYSPLAPPCPHP